MEFNHPLLADLSAHVFIPCEGFSHLGMIQVLTKASTLRLDAYQAYHAKKAKKAPRGKAAPKRSKRAQQLDLTISLDYEAYEIACKYYRIKPLPKPAEGAHE
jgi:hypothetical protein